MQWDQDQAHQLFHDLNTGRKIPKSLISGSSVGSKLAG